MTVALVTAINLVVLFPARSAAEAATHCLGGASHGKDHADIVTLAEGFRSAVPDNLLAGAANEIPLTDENENFMESRITVDLIWNFSFAFCFSSYANFMHIHRFSFASNGGIFLGKYLDALRGELVSLCRWLDWLRGHLLHEHLLCYRVAM